MTLESTIYFWSINPFINSYIDLFDLNLFRSFAEYKSCLLMKLGRYSSLSDSFSPNSCLYNVCAGSPERITFPWNLFNKYSTSFSWNLCTSSKMITSNEFILVSSSNNDLNSLIGWILKSKHLSSKCPGFKFPPWKIITFLSESI